GRATRDEAWPGGGTGVRQNRKREGQATCSAGGGSRASYRLQGAESLRGPLATHEPPVPRDGRRRRSPRGRWISTRQRGPASTAGGALPSPARRSIPRAGGAKRGPPARTRIRGRAAPAVAGQGAARGPEAC